jgi:glycosyltransferase involved in cell wall biosynthesis
MRIIAVVNSIKSGGAERQLLLLARRLADLGWSFEIWPLVSSDRPENMDVFVREAACAGVVIRWPTENRIVSSISIGWRLLSLSFDFVWTWGARTECLGQLVGMVNRKFILVNSVRMPLEKRVKLSGLVDRILICRTRLVISNSELGVQLASDSYSRGVEKAVRLPNILNFDRGDTVRAMLPKCLPKKLRILMLGHLRTWEKGYDLLPSVLDHLTLSGLSYEVIVGGRNDDGGEVLAEIRKGQSGKHFTYYGEITDTAEFLSSGHLFLMTSRVEGSPNAMLEAMYRGCICVCTPVGDIGHTFLPSEHLFAASSLDSGSISDAVLEACRDWEKAKAVAMRGKRLVEGWVLDEERIVAKADSIFKELEEVPYLSRWG